MYGADIFSILVTRSVCYKKWTDEEHQLYAEGLKLYGEDFGKVSEVVKTKTYE